MTFETDYPELYLLHKFTKPTHGNCCTCQTCGHWHDECKCLFDVPEIEQFCLSKQRVKEAIIRLKARNKPNRNNELFDFDSSVRLFEQELGLQ